MSSEVLEQLSEHICASLKKVDVSAEIVLGELIVRVPRADLLKVISFLHDDVKCLFKVLIDVSGVDYPQRKERFDVVYQLLSLKHNNRIRVKVATSEDEPVASVGAIHPSAGWFEREVWDMYGVFFSGNPDLRRILTDYGFDGHPLRKDFPLTGHVEMHYDEEQKRVVYAPVNLPQAYRSFDDVSPWQGVDYDAIAKAANKAG